jgi:putative ABC transport system permease protein
MINREGIKYSFRNMKNSKSRSLLTIFSILIGITTLFIFISFGLGLYEYVNEIAGESSANKLIVQARGVGAPGLDDSFKLTNDDIDVIQKVSGVDEVTGSYFKPVEVRKDEVLKYVFLVSYDPKIPIMLEVSNIGIEEGRWLRGSDPKKVILGYNFKEDDNIFEEGYDIGDKINIQGEDLRVVGFFEPVGNPQDDSNIYITNDYFEEAYPETDYYGMIIVESNERNLDPVVDRITEKLRKERGLEEGKEDFYVQSFQDLIQSYASSLNIVVGFIILIALISVIVSAVNTANTMVTSVLERFKEIGILKAVGAKNSEIFFIFLFESAFLGFIAGCLGVLFGWVFTYSAKLLLEGIGYGFLTPSNNPYIFIGCILFATITGAVSGVFPSRNASKINTVEALRYE